MVQLFSSPLREVIRIRLLLCGNKLYSEPDAKISRTLQAFHSMKNKLLTITQKITLSMMEFTINGFFRICCPISVLNWIPLTE